MRTPRTLAPASPLLRRRSLALLGAALLSGFGTASEPASAGELPDLRLIVHPSNPVQAAERSFVADAFLKKVTRWGGGGEVIRPVDLRVDSTVRRRFSEAVLKRSVAAVRSYWQQRIFSGRDVPPLELDSEDAVVRFVAQSPGALGYVSSAAKLVGVRELSLK